MSLTRGRVLAVMNQFHGYDKSITDALQKLGFEAQWSDARPSNSVAVKALTRLGLLQRLKFISKANVERIAKDARDFKADTILLISPENLRGPEMEQLREAVPNIRIVLYLFDSAVNRSLDQSMIDQADSAYSFDMDDCDAYSDLNFVPLFHHHKAFVPTDASDVSHSFDYCFIGTARVRRIKILAGIARKAKQKNERYYFYLFAPSFVQYAVFWFFATLYRFDGILSRQSVPFDIYLETLAKSACVVDIEQQDQGGLTIRTMDAVFAGRPLATTNPNITRHDFFPHFPVSMLSTETLSVEVPQPRKTTQAEAFFHKYHIGNWLETILTDHSANYRLDGSSENTESTAKNVTL
jgi:hypothetical protein